VLINWLVKEGDLWKAPMDLITLHEKRKIDIFTRDKEFREIA